MTKEFKFSNGDEVKERITGYSGTITGTCFYLTGCNQYLITGQSVDNKEPVALWYDESRIDLVNNTYTESDFQGVDNGCDISPTSGMRGN